MKKSRLLISLKIILYLILCTTPWQLYKETLLVGFILLHFHCLHCTRTSCKGRLRAHSHGHNSLILTASCIMQPHLPQEKKIPIVFLETSSLRNHPTHCTLKIQKSENTLLSFTNSASLQSQAPLLL